MQRIISECNQNSDYSDSSDQSSEDSQQNINRYHQQVKEKNDPKANFEVPYNEHYMQTERECCLFMNQPMNQESSSNKLRHTEDLKTKTRFNPQQIHSVCSNSPLLGKQQISPNIQTKHIQGTNISLQNSLVLISQSSNGLDIDLEANQVPDIDLNQDVYDFTSEFSVKELWDTQSQYHPNGKKKSEAIYVNGHLIGVKKSWYPSGILMSQGTYHGSQGTMDPNFESYIQEWYENENIKQYSQYKGAKLHGFVRVWYDNNMLESLTHYKNGHKDGLELQMYKSGNYKSATMYKNGQIIGLSKQWENIEKSNVNLLNPILEL